MVVGTDAPQAHEFFARQPERLPERLEVLVHQAGRKAIVAGIDRRVRGEDRALGDFLRARLEVGSGRLHAQTCGLERREGAVAFVEVQDAPIDAGGTQRANAAHTEQELLANADALIAEVEPRGELPVLVGVALEIGVEQEVVGCDRRSLPRLARAASRWRAAPGRSAERPSARRAGDAGRPSAGERMYSACWYPSRSRRCRKYDSR